MKERLLAFCRADRIRVIICPLPAGYLGGAASIPGRQPRILVREGLPERVSARVLAHELGHLYTDAFYSVEPRHGPVHRRCERVANGFAAGLLARLAAKGRA